MSTARIFSGALPCAATRFEHILTVTHHRGKEGTDDSQLLSRFCPMAVLNGAWIDIIGDEEPGSLRTTAYWGRRSLGNILQQLLYLASTAAKVICVFDIMVRQQVA